MIAKILLIATLGLHHPQLYRVCAFATETGVRCSPAMPMSKARVVAGALAGFAPHTQPYIQKKEKPSKTVGFQAPDHELAPIVVVPPDTQI